MTYYSENNIKRATKNTITNIYLVFLISLIFVGFKANALSFKLSKSEFNSWDMRCKAYYVMTGYGASSGFKKYVPQSEYDRWDAKKSIRKTGPWHYCAGLIWLRRAKTEQNETKREKYYQKAKGGSLWTYARIDKSIPWSAEMAVTIAYASQQLKEFQQAHEYYDLAIKHHKKYEPAYAGKSLLYRKQGQLNNAIQFLELNINKLNLLSPELNYFLGLFYFENNDYENSAIYGAKAYDLGYPLPALRMKLKQKGYEI